LTFGLHGVGLVGVVPLISKRYMNDTADR
jgi:hypothetical protein